MIAGLRAGAEGEREMPDNDPAVQAQEFRQQLSLIDSIRRRLLCVDLKGMDRQNVA
jgi:hypothetical protein